MPLLRDITISDPVTRKAAARLLHWDFVLDKDSVEAGIYEMFQRRLMENVKNTIVPTDARAYITPPMTRIVATLAAPDGSAALALFREQPVDLVLTDVMMPLMSGPQLMSKIHEENRDVRCIFMSGYTSEQIKEAGAGDPGWPARCRKSGC